MQVLPLSVAAALALFPTVEDEFEFDSRGFSALRRATLYQADQMAQGALGALGASDDPCRATAELAASATVSSLRADLALALSQCLNEESASMAKLEACLEEAFDAYSEGLELLRVQHRARLQLCELTGGGVYDPDLDEDEFVAGVDHPYFPLAPGSERVYRKVTDEGVEEVTVTVTDETLVIDDIECVAVRDVVTLDGVFVEDTTDWYAQDADGTVWYMGEIAQNFEDGLLVDLDGSWRAGEDGGLPGVVMLAAPESSVGATYRQELLLTEAEDAATVVSAGESVRVGETTYENCLQTFDFTPIDPEALEYKYYAPGIGVVLEIDLLTGERLELVSFDPGG